MKIKKQIFDRPLHQICWRRPLAVATLIGTLAFSTLASSEIYKSTNKAGTPVFSDIKTKSSKPIVLPPLETHSFPKANTEESFEAAPAQTHQPVNYSTLLIQSPSKDQVIRNTSGNLSISVSIAPPLQENHRIQVLIDGATVSEPQQETDFELTEIYRGTHQLSVQIIDTSDNSIIKTSSPVQVHVKQHSILH
ncbi:MAG: hypothetical protein P1U80_01765 [Pseudomonadales bacterium]|nr:hypothetical protein [Pseudomonadales bacterium]